MAAGLDRRSLVRPVSSKGPNQFSRRSRTKAPTPGAPTTTSDPRALGPSSEELTIKGVGMDPVATPALDTRVSVSDLQVEVSEDVSAGHELAMASRPTSTVIAGASPFMPSVPLNRDLDWHLARRASPAVSNRLVYRIRKAGRKAWLEQQLKPSTIPDPVVDQFLTTVPQVTASAYDIINKHYGWQLAHLTSYAVQRATMVRRAWTTRVVHESMVEFWHDLLHITSPSDKGSVWISDYDTNVIRKFALGKFTTLLHRATTHAAMLQYLDNSVSTKDAPNENLGRELLELHTVGVGNFTEQDVKQLTLLLTGFRTDWTAMKSRYDPYAHYVGPVTVLGYTHANESPESGPTYLLRMTKQLARHPKTARRICTKLAIRFVSDKPPASLIDRLTKVYLDNDTYIVPVLRALFLSPEFNASVGHKWRRPSESWASMVAISRPSAPVVPDTWPSVPGALMATDATLLHRAGHLPLAWPAPDGYPDTAVKWMSSNDSLEAWNRAEAVAANWSKSYTITPWDKVFGITPTMHPKDAVLRIFKTATGFVPDSRSMYLLTRFLWSGSSTGPMPPEDAELGPDRIKAYLAETVRLVFSSPYFQIR